MFHVILAQHGDEYIASSHETLEEARRQARDFLLRIHERGLLTSVVIVMPGGQRIDPPFSA